MLFTSGDQMTQPRTSSIPHSGPNRDVRGNSGSEGIGHDDDEAHQVEFSTENNSLVPTNNIRPNTNQSLQLQRVSTRNEKIQGFLPRELLTFLNVDPEKIEQIMNEQHERHPSMFMTVVPSNKHSSVPDSSGVPNIENQREVIFDEVKKLLIKVVSQE